MENLPHGDLVVQDTTSNYNNSTPLRDPRRLVPSKLKASLEKENRRPRGIVKRRWVPALRGNDINLAESARMRYAYIVTQASPGPHEHEGKLRDAQRRTAAESTMARRGDRCIAHRPHRRGRSALCPTDDAQVLERLPGRNTAQFRQLKT